VPTVADLKARRMELTRASIRAAIVEGDLDHYRVIVEALSSEFDVMEIALAAVKLAHTADAGEVTGEEEEIPSPVLERFRDSPPRGRDGGRFDRGPDRGPGGGGPPRRRPGGPPVARLFISAGRDAGISPRDLVGAISHAAGVPSHDIGGIDIAERFSLVDVPEDAAEYVIECLQGARIRGRRVNIRRDRRDAQ